MEMYGLNVLTLKKFITFSCRLKQLHVTEMMQLASTILPVQFMARAVNEKLDLNVGVPDFTSGLKIKSDFHSFDEAKYFRVFVDKTGNPQRRAEIMRQISKLRKTLTPDLRHKAHGHDFITLLFEYVGQNGGVRLHNKKDEIIKFGGRLLTTALDFDSLAEELLFAQIMKAATGEAYMSN